jgi:hypothetical protein
MTTTYKRFGKRWTVNECLQLQREFELLQLSIDDIAQRHQRTPNGIMLKLDSEGFADYNVLYSNYHDFNNQMNPQPNNTDECSEIDDDNSSNYDDNDFIRDHVSDVDDDCDDDSYDNANLKFHVMRLEKKLNALTDALMQQNKSKKSVFSLFS